MPWRAAGAIAARGVKPPVSSGDVSPIPAIGPGVFEGRAAAGEPACRSIRKRAGRVRRREEPVPVRPLVLGEKAADLGPQVVVPAAGGAEPVVPSGGVEPDRGIERARRSVANAPASFVSPPSRRRARRRASRQSRSTVTTETPNAAATSGPSSRRIAQGHDLACRSSRSASRSRASWTATTSDPLLEVVDDHVERHAAPTPAAAASGPPPGSGR